MTTRNSYAWAELGGDPTPGDPNQIRRHAGRLGSTADRADDIHARVQRLRANGTGGIWVGPAADAFAAKLGTLPEHIDKLRQSYRTASNALYDFARMLDPLQARADRLCVQATTALQSYQSSLRTRDEQTTSNPHVDAGSLDHAVASAKTNLSSATAQVQNLRKEYQTAQQRCVDQLHAASAQGLHNEMFGSVRRLVREVTIEVHAGLVADLRDLSAIVDVVGNLLSDASLLLTIAAFVSVIVQPEFAPLLFGLAEAASTGSTAADAVKTEADLGRAALRDPGATHDLKGDLTNDAFDVVGAGLGHFAKPYEDQAKTLIQASGSFRAASNTFEDVSRSGSRGVSVLASTFHDSSMATSEILARQADHPIAVHESLTLVDKSISVFRHDPLGDLEESAHTLKSRLSQTPIDGFQIAIVPITSTLVTLGV